MDGTLRVATADELDEVGEIFRIAFGLPEAEVGAWVATLDPARTLVAPDGRGGLAGASHIRPFAQWFGGRPVPLAGYSPVAVLPEHRGRGLGRALVTGHLADLRDRGEVVAGLFPASVGLYRSTGFELAGSYVQRRIPAAHLGALRPSTPVSIRRGRPDDVAPVHDAYARMARWDGALVRDAGWWARRLPPDLSGTMLYVACRGDAVAGPGAPVDGYAVYRSGPGRFPYDYSVRVTEVVAADPDVARALWRVVGSSGTQAPDVHVVGPAEDPLFLLVDAAEPTAVRSEIRWMLRLVDAPAAVAARGWRASARGEVHLEVADDAAPWNAGRWVLEVADGDGRLRPGGDGTVRIGIGGLSSWWAGYARALVLQATGHLRASDPAAVAVLDDLGAASPPWLVDFY